MNLNNIKKVSTILSIILFTSLIILNSCVKNEETISSQTKGQRLINELKTFNNGYVTNTPNNEKDFWGAIGKVCKVASADIIGAGTAIWASGEIAAAAGCCTGGVGAGVVATVAGVVGCAGGSYAAYSANPGGGQNMDTSNIIIPKDFYYLSNIGVYHNMILKDVFFNNIPVKEWVDKNEKRYGSCINEVIKSDKWNNLNDTLQNTFKKYPKINYDYKLTLNDFYKKNYINKNIKDILLLYLNIYTKSNSFEDIDKISEFYINKISSSDLEIKEKESLISSFLVGANSPRFWFEK